MGKLVDVLTADAKAELIRLRLQDKLSVTDVIERMKAITDTPIKAWMVYALCAKRGPKKAKAAKSVATRVTKKAAPKKRKASAKATVPAAGSEHNLHNLVDMLITECGAYTQYVFMRARREIIKHIAETREKRIAAGEEVPLLDIEDVA